VNYAPLASNGESYRFRTGLTRVIGKKLRNDVCEVDWAVRSIFWLNFNRMGAFGFQDRHGGIWAARSFPKKGFADI
jgi:hypothetical protein